MESITIGMGQQNQIPSHSVSAGGESQTEFVQLNDERLEVNLDKCKAKETDDKTPAQPVHQRKKRKIFSWLKRIFKNQKSKTNKVAELIKKDSISNHKLITIRKSKADVSDEKDYLKSPHSFEFNPIPSRNLHDFRSKSDTSLHRFTLGNRETVQYFSDTNIGYYVADAALKRNAKIILCNNTNSSIETTDMNPLIEPKPLKSILRKTSRFSDEGIIDLGDGEQKIKRKVSFAPIETSEIQEYHPEDCGSSIKESPSILRFKRSHLKPVFKHE